METNTVIETKKMPYWVNNNILEKVGYDLICKANKTKDIPIEIFDENTIIGDIFWVITGGDMSGLFLCKKMPKKVNSNEWDFKAWNLCFFNNSKSDITFDLYVQTVRKTGLIDVRIF